MFTYLASIYGKCIGKYAIHYMGSYGALNLLIVCKLTFQNVVSLNHSLSFGSGEALLAASVASLVAGRNLHSFPMTDPWDDCMFTYMKNHLKNRLSRIIKVPIFWRDQTKVNEVILRDCPSKMHCLGW